MPLRKRLKIRPSGHERVISEVYYSIIVTRFWKINLNVTFYNSNIYDQNEAFQTVNHFTVTRIISQYLELQILTSAQIF